MPTNNKRKAEEQLVKEDAADADDDAIRPASIDKTSDAMEESKKSTDADDADDAGDAGDGNDDGDDDDDEEVAVVTVDAAAAPVDAKATAVEEDKDDKDDKDDDKDEHDEDGMGSTPSGKRRFFPRVKHLLTREWEPFLIGVLNALEQSEAPHCAAASHKLSNPWYKGFDVIYNGVAADCSLPHGKNRYHKFKDKIVELWVAMEQHAPDDHPYKAKAVAQLEDYRKACADHVATPKKEGGVTPKASLKAASERASNRRLSFATTAALRWKHLDETAALECLSEPLKSLLNVRQLTIEVGSGNKSDLEEHYERALDEYLKEIPTNKEALYEKTKALTFLTRYAQSQKEVKVISESFERVQSDYLLTLGVGVASTMV